MDSAMEDGQTGMAPGLAADVAMGSGPVRLMATCASPKSWAEASRGGPGEQARAPTDIASSEEDLQCTDLPRVLNAEPMAVGVHPASPDKGNGLAAGSMSISSLLSDDARDITEEDEQKKPKNIKIKGFKVRPLVKPNAGAAKSGDVAPWEDDEYDLSDGEFLTAKAEYQAELRKRQRDIEDAEDEHYKVRRAAQLRKNLISARARLLKMNDTARRAVCDEAIHSVKMMEEILDKERRTNGSSNAEDDHNSTVEYSKSIRSSTDDLRSAEEMIHDSQLMGLLGDDEHLGLGIDEIKNDSDTDFAPPEAKKHNKRIHAPPTQKQYDTVYELIWRDLSRKDGPKTYRLYSANLATKQINFRKTAQLSAKEARRWQFRTNKSVKDLQVKAKRAMREMLVFWKRNERDERDSRRKAEKDAADRAKKWEEQREARRQARKLNFLITQTELYSHFIGRKIKTDKIEGTEGSSLINNEIENNLNTDLNSSVVMREKVSNFNQLDFDAEDEASLKDIAISNAQHAIKEAKDRADQFNKIDIEGKPQPDMDLSNVNLDDGELNFQNPTGMGEIDIQAPKMLKAQLKEYQLKGLNWLVNLYEQGINGILADEMGLGKTVQSISVMAYLAEKHGIWGPFLVIAPASTLHNWQQEITRFVPSLKALPYWGNAKDRKILRKFWDRSKLTYDKDAPFHVLITSYQLVVSDAQYFSRVKWQYMILDEAQAIKSSSSSRWKSLLGFQCRNRLLLTGTPIQNSMQELWALLHFIMPSLFDSHDEFSEWFSKDIESHAQSNTQLNEQQLKRLHMILKPFMLRRVKKHVQKELGEKIELDVYCDLTYRQRAMYRGLREKISLLDLIEKAVGGGEQDSQSLMNLVMQFRKVCNHPELFERAETRSPLFLASFAETGSLLREGSPINASYTCCNFLSYRIPKFLYRNGGKLDVVGENSSAGFRNRYVNHLFNIWNPNYISQSQEDDKAFSWLHLIDEAAQDVAGAFHQSILWSAIQTKPHRPKILVPLRLNKEDSPIINSLYTVGIRELRTRLLHQMEPSYEPRALAPPIALQCSDQGATVEEESILFDQLMRKSLLGPNPHDEAQLLDHDVDPAKYPLPRLFPSPFLESLSFSYIRVPAMSRFVTDSGKLAKLDQLLAELKANDHRVLLYFQMTRMIDLMEEYLAFRQYKYLRLDGSSKLADRRDMVEDWQTRPDLFIFLLSTRAGGLGINLTAADTVIFYDSDWNPTIDSQAMDRAHRLGQTKQVTVYRLITRGTIEERILKRAKQKEEVQKVVISGGDFKQNVDFNKGSREVAMWLLDDEEMEAKFKERDAQRVAERMEAQKKNGGIKSKKRKLGVAVLDGPMDTRTMEDMYHEGEGNFDDSGRPSEAATPTSSASTMVPKKKLKGGRVHKKKTVAEKLELVGDAS